MHTSTVTAWNLVMWPICAPVSGKRLSSFLRGQFVFCYISSRLYNLAFQSSVCLSQKQWGSQLSWRQYTWKQKTAYSTWENTLFYICLHPKHNDVLQYLKRRCRFWTSFVCVFHQHPCNFWLSKWWQSFIIGWMISLRKFQLMVMKRLGIISLNSVTEHSLKEPSLLWLLL